MFQVESPRLVLVTTPLEAIQRRLANESETFQNAVMLQGGTIHVTFPPEWPGDALAIFPMELERRTRDPEYFPWGGTIIERAERVAVGTMGAKGQPDMHGAIEIGYGINPSYWGRGYASEMVAALTAWLFQQPRVQRVTAETRQDNQASIRVLQKNGFARVGERVDEEDGPLFLWARG